MRILYLCGGWPEEAGGKDNGQVVGSHFVNVFMLCYPEGKKKGGWEREREGGREGGREEGRKEGREGGREGGKEGGMDGWREAGRQGGREPNKEEKNTLKTAT